MSRVYSQNNFQIIFDLTFLKLLKVIWLSIIIGTCFTTFSQHITGMRVVPISANQAKVEIDIYNSTSYDIQHEEIVFLQDSILINMCYVKSLFQEATDSTFEYLVQMNATPKWHHLKFNLSRYSIGTGLDTCGGPGTSYQTRSLNFYHPSSDTAFLGLVDETVSNESFTISPNPSAGIFLWQGTGQQVIGQIQVFSPEGRLLIDEQMHQLKQSADLDLTSFHKGMYVLKCIDTKGRMYFRSIQKM